VDPPIDARGEIGIVLAMHSRRSFFGVTAGAAAASLIQGRGTRAALAAPRSHALKLGIASYSLRKLPLSQVLEACKATDIRHITLKDMHLPRDQSAESVKATAETIRAAGLTLMGGGVITMKPEKGAQVDAAFEATVRKDFEYAKAAGFPLIVAAPAIEALDIVEKLVKEYNIPVAIHNHGPEDKLFPSPKAILAHVKKRDKRLGVCMDIGHTVRAGADPAKSALECGPRLLDLHIKDLVKNPDAPPDKAWSQVEVGRGSIDIVALFKTLQKMKFQGHVALEYEINVDNPLPGVRESWAYLRGVAAGLGAV
jgi:sugar phosphate isomerase/epimerase